MEIDHLMKPIEQELNKIIMSGTGGIRNHIALIKSQFHCQL